MFFKECCTPHGVWVAFSDLHRWFGRAFLRQSFLTQPEDDKWFKHLLHSIHNGWESIYIYSESTMLIYPMKKLILFLRKLSYIFQTKERFCFNSECRASVFLFVQFKSLAMRKQFSMNIIFRKSDESIIYLNVTTRLWIPTGSVLCFCK